MPMPRVGGSGPRPSSADSAGNGVAVEKTLRKVDGGGEAAPQRAESGGKVAQAADRSESAGQSTGGGEKAAEKADTADKGGQKADPANSAGQTTNPSETTANSQTSPSSTDATGSGQNADAVQNQDVTAEIIKVRGDSMELDPNHARLRRNGDVFLFANSSATSEVDLQAPASSISIFAHADKGGGEWPRIQVSVDGTPMGEVTVNSTQEKKYFLPIYADPGHSVVQFTFLNDYHDPSTGEDRNVYINKVKIHTQTK